MYAHPRAVVTPRPRHDVVWTSADIKQYSSSRHPVWSWTDVKPHRPTRHAVWSWADVKFPSEKPSNVVAFPHLIRARGTVTDLRLGDCLEEMRKMPSESIDLVFTSPPYNLRNTSGGGIPAKGGKWSGAALRNGYASHSDDMPHDDYVAWQKDVLRECWRLIRPTGAIYYNHKPLIRNGLVRLPTEYNPDLPIRQIVIWNRGSGINFSTSHYVPCHEWIIILAKPGFRLRDKAASGAMDVWKVTHERNNPHPAPFPVELPRIALETTNAQEILDPFAGSGSTGVACKMMGRKFIGIDHDPGYLSMARDRIAAA
jgi:DNA modification methylase